MYADVITRSMQEAMDETQRRRGIQQAYNRRHRITPRSIQKEITAAFAFGHETEAPKPARVKEPAAAYASLEEMDEAVKSLEALMHAAARDLDFERAAELRDDIHALKRRMVLEN